jgi:hypothetical protein
MLFPSKTMNFNPRTYKDLSYNSWYLLIYEFKLKKNLSSVLNSNLIKIRSYIAHLYSDNYVVTTQVWQNCTEYVYAKIIAISQKVALILFNCERTFTIW